MTPSFGLEFGGIFDTSIGPRPWTLLRDGLGPEHIAAIVAFVSSLSLHGLEAEMIVSNDSSFTVCPSLLTMSFECFVSLRLSGQDIVMMDY